MKLTIRVEQIARVSDLRACGNELMFSYLGKKYLIWKEFMGDILFTRTFPGEGGNREGANLLNKQT